MQRALRNRRAETLPDDLKGHYEEMFGDKFPLKLDEAWEYVRNKFNELGITSLQIMSSDGKVRVEHHWSRLVPSNYGQVVNVPNMGNMQQWSGGFASTTSATSLSGLGQAAQFSPAPPRYQAMMDYWSTNELTPAKLDKFVSKIIKQLGEQNNGELGFKTS